MPSLERSERHPSSQRRLPRARLGIVPIVWNNADLSDLGPRVPAAAVMDEIVRLDFEGLQNGVDFPEGQALRDALARRGLALAEVYAALPCGADGPAPEALDVARRRLDLLHVVGGELLVVALGFSDGRVEHAGRSTQPGVAQLSAEGWNRLAGTLEELARESDGLGHRLCFHPHAGTYVENSREVERLLAATDPSLVGLCLDTGHCLLGGGDPVEWLNRHGQRVVHVHLKDVAGDVLARVRAGSIDNFHDALRERIFTELGRGVLDLPAVAGALDELGYGGWLMVEQDTSWRSPSESAAISRAALDDVLGPRPRGTSTAAERPSGSVPAAGRPAT